MLERIWSALKEHPYFAVASVAIVVLYFTLKGGSGTDTTIGVSGSAPDPNVLAATTAQATTAAALQANATNDAANVQIANIQANAQMNASSSALEYALASVSAGRDVAIAQLGTTQTINAQNVDAAVSANANTNATNLAALQNTNATNYAALINNNNTAYNITGTTLGAQENLTAQDNQSKLSLAQESDTAAQTSQQIAGGFDVLRANNANLAAWTQQIQADNASYNTLDKLNALVNNLIQYGVDPATLVNVTGPAIAKQPAPQVVV